ncbi:MAG: sugar ABC transporter permease [Ruthenibacterium sp.]
MSLPYAKKYKKRTYRGQAVVGLLLLVPSFAFLAIFKYYPALLSLFYSFTNWDGFSDPTFIGLKNFIKLFQDEVFFKSLQNVAIWTVMYCVQCIIPPLIAAELIFHLKSKRMQYFYRVLLIIPMVVPEIVNQLIWQLIYDGDIGMVNQMLRAVGLGEWARNWLGDPQLALWALIFMNFPWIHAFNMLMFYSGLQSIPSSILESSTLEGLGAFGKIRRMHLPFLVNQVKIAIILATIACLQTVTAPLVMTSGGPGYATYVPALHMYLSAFANSNFGYAMAQALVLFVVIMLLTMLSNRMKSETEFEA